MTTARKILEMELPELPRGTLRNTPGAQQYYTASEMQLYARICLDHALQSYSGQPKQTKPTAPPQDVVRDAEDRVKLVARTYEIGYLDGHEDTTNDRYEPLAFCPESIAKLIMEAIDAAIAKEAK